MKNARFIAFLTLFVFCSTFTLVFADSVSLYLKGGAGFSGNEDVDDILNFSAGAMKEFGSFSIELTGRVESVTMLRTTFDATSFGSGNLNAKSILLLLGNRFNIANDLSFYINYGLGYSFYSMDPENILEPTDPNSYSVDIDSSLIFSFGTGIEYKISRMISIVADASDTIAEAEGAAIVSDPTGAEIYSIDVTEKSQQEHIKSGNENQSVMKLKKRNSNKVTYRYSFSKICYGFV